MMNALKMFDQCVPERSSDVCGDSAATPVSNVVALLQQHSAGNNAGKSGDEELSG